MIVITNTTSSEALSKRGNEEYSANNLVIILLENIKFQINLLRILNFSLELYILHIKTVVIREGGGSFPASLPGNYILRCMHCLVLWTAGITNEEIGRDGNEEETKEDNHINRLQFVKQNETPYNSFVCQLFIITLFCNFVRPYRMQAFLHDSFTVFSIFFHKRSHFRARNT